MKLGLTTLRRDHLRSEADPERVGICNCTDCQVLSGSGASPRSPGRKTSVPFQLSRHSEPGSDARTFLE
jgi:hypothetical protein